MIQIGQTSILYIDSAVYFEGDSSIIFIDTMISPEKTNITFKDTVNNLALTFHIYSGDKNLDSLVDKLLSLNGGFDYSFDTVKTDSGDVSHCYRYARAFINDTLEYISFALGKKKGNHVIIFANASYGDEVGQRYRDRIHDFNFVIDSSIHNPDSIPPDTVVNDTTPPDTVVPVRTKTVPAKKAREKWKPGKYYLMKIGGWTYNLKGMRRKEI